MKKLLLTVLLAGSLSSSAFDVHLFKGDGSEGQTITDATKIVFGKDKTVITNNSGTDLEVANTTFAHMGFTASSAVSEITVSEKYTMTIGRDAITLDTENVESIEVFNLSGMLVAKTAKSCSCAIDILNAGTYIVRVTVDGNVIVKKFFKKA